MRVKASEYTELRGTVVGANPEDLQKDLPSLTREMSVDIKCGSALSYRYGKYHPNFTCKITSFQPTTTIQGNTNSLFHRGKKITAIANNTHTKTATVLTHGMPASPQLVAILVPSHGQKQDFCRRNH